jgi:hypothetical protein
LAIERFRRSPMDDRDRAPFDQATFVDADELAEWLRLEADEVKVLARAGIFPRDEQGRFPLVRPIRGYIRLEEARAAIWETDARRSA